MSASLTENAQSVAWQELHRISGQIRALQSPEIRAVFAIGSLPGGYFRPGQSDLDVVVILAGSPPQDEARCNALQQLSVTIRDLASAAKPYELEATFVYESELMRDPKTGVLPRADFASRLLTQSQVLMGEFDLQKIDNPLPQDFIPIAERYLEYRREKYGPASFGTVPLPELVKHILTLMRYYLIIKRQHVQYNKFQLVQDYERFAPELPMPTALKTVILRFLQDKSIQPEEVATFRKELPQFEQALVAAMLPSKPE